MYRQADIQAGGWMGHMIAKWQEGWGSAKKQHDTCNCNGNYKMNNPSFMKKLIIFSERRKTMEKKIVDCLDKNCNVTSDSCNSGDFVCF